jgi:hypothetical protein
MTRAELNTARWQRTRRSFIAQWIVRYGRTCAGWQRPPHPAWPLEADDIQPRSLAGGLQALCKPCNSSKQAKRPGQKPKPTTRAAIHEERR